jgi:hypothetical protein
MTPGRREWDIQVLRTCFFHHDIQEICKIRISGRMEEDKIAWQYEKASMFSVRREYKLALQQGTKVSGLWVVAQMRMATGRCIRAYGRHWYLPRYVSLHGVYLRKGWRLNATDEPGNWSNGLRVKFVVVKRKTGTMQWSPALRRGR